MDYSLDGLIAKYGADAETTGNALIRRLFAIARNGGQPLPHVSAPVAAPRAERTPPCDYGFCDASWHTNACFARRAAFARRTGQNVYRLDGRRSIQDRRRGVR